MPKGTSVYIQIVDPTDTPIPNARISFGRGSNRRTVTVSSLGSHLFEDIQPADLENRRFAANVQAEGFAPASTGFHLPDGGHLSQKLTLLPYGKRHQIDPRKTSTLVDDNLRVTIPGWGVVDSEGNTVVDKIDATIVRIDADSNLMLYAPAPFETQQEGSPASVGLKTLGMFDITLWRGDEQLQLRPNSYIDLEVTIPPAFKDAYKAGDRIPRWSLDLADAYWRADGDGELVSVGDELIWRSRTPHLSWFNLDFEDDCTECPLGNVHMCLRVQIRSQDVNTPPPKFYPYHVKGTHKGWVEQSQFHTESDGDDCLRIYYGFAGDRIDISPGLAPNFTALPETYYMPAVTGAWQCNPDTDCPLVEFYINNVCIPGSYTFEGCEDQGPYTKPEVDGKGSCLSARRYCKVDGTDWEPSCTQHVYPEAAPGEPTLDLCPMIGADVSENLIDTNCDGVVDPGCEFCDGGESYGCYDGNPANYRVSHDGNFVIHQDPITNQLVKVPIGDVTAVPVCKEGKLVCNESGSGFTGDCSGQELPQPMEDCATGNDETCDGVATCQGMTVNAASSIGAPAVQAPDALYDAIVDRAGTPADSTDDGVIVLYRGSDASLSDSCLQEGPNPALGVYLARFAFYPNPNNPTPGITCQWRQKLGEYSWNDQTKFHSSLGISDGEFHDDIASLSLAQDGTLLVTGTATAPIQGPGGIGPGCDENVLLIPESNADVYIGAFASTTGQCESQRLVAGAPGGKQHGLAIAGGQSWTPMNQKPRDDFWLLAQAVGNLALPGCDIQAANSLVIAKMYDDGQLHCEQATQLPMDPGTSVSPFGLRLRFDGNGEVDRGWLGLNFTGKVGGQASEAGDAILYALDKNLVKSLPVRVYGAGTQYVHTFYDGPKELMIGGRAENSVTILNNAILVNDWQGSQPFWAVLDHDLKHLTPPAFAIAGLGAGSGAVRGGFSSLNEVQKHLVLGFQVTESINLGGGEYKVNPPGNWDIFVARLRPTEPKHEWSEGFGSDVNNSAGNQSVQFLLPVSEGNFVLVGTYENGLALTSPPLEPPAYERGFVAIAGG